MDEVKTVNEKPIRVLLLDDESDFCFLIKENLRRIGGYKVITVKKPKMSVWFAFKHWQKPDVILLDIMMPGGINGLDVLNKLKTDFRTKDIPVIMLTACEDDNTKNSARKSGCADYIIKPVTIAELTSRINKVLGRPERVLPANIDQSQVSSSESIQQI